MDSLEPARGLHHRPRDGDTNVTPRLAPMTCDVTDCHQARKVISFLPPLSKGLSLIMPLVRGFYSWEVSDPPGMSGFTEEG